MSTTLKWPMAYILACIADTLNHLLRATPMVYAIRGTVAMQATYMYDSNGFTTDYWRHTLHVQTLHVLTSSTSGES